jgi:hypothetical protein
MRLAWLLALVIAVVAILMVLGQVPASKEVVGGMFIATLLVAADPFPARP